MIPIFNENAKCPKCHFLTVDINYCEKGHMKLSSGPHFHRTCKRCSFTWIEATLSDPVTEIDFADTYHPEFKDKGCPICDVIDRVAFIYDIDPNLIINSNSRVKIYTTPRFVIEAVLYQTTFKERRACLFHREFLASKNVREYRLTLKAIGKILNRDHTTVLYGLDVVSSSPGLKQQVAEVVAFLSREDMKLVA